MSYITQILTTIVLCVIALLACPRQSMSASSVPPCGPNSESRALAFWLGSWTVTNNETPARGTSRVYPELGDCVVTESWNGRDGHRGLNLFAYDPEERTWHGFFADNHGRVHIFTRGHVDGGVAEFFGATHGNNGTTLNRIRLVRVSANAVEQNWAQSSTNGATWKTVFLGKYIRV